MGTARELQPSWLEALQDVIYVIRLSPDFAFEFISDSVTDLVGYTPEEHYNDPDLGNRIVDPRDVDRLAAATRLPPGERLEVTLRWISRDGHSVWTQHRCMKQVRPDGSVALIGSARDVTEQVRDRESLAAAREQYRLIAENASDVVFRGTNEGRIEWLSETVVDVLGWSPGDLAGMSFQELVHPEDRSLVRQTQVMLARGESGSFEVRLRTRKGEWHWVAVSVRPVFDADGTVIGRVGGWRDIQSRVTLRNALMSSESLFRTMMGNSTVGAVLTDATCRITTISDTACEILGGTREELLGRAWPSLVEESDRADVRQAFSHVIQGDRDSVRGVRRLRRLDGRPLWADESLAGVRDEHGEAASFLIQIYDITQAVEARQELQRSREEYRLLAENAADVVLRLSETSQATWVSPSATRLTGYALDEVLGRPVLEFLHPLDFPRAQAALARVFDSTAESATEEIRIRHHDGKYAWWQATARLTEQIQVVLTLRNVDAEVNARAAAALEQTRRAAAVQSMLDPHVLLVARRDADDKITDFQIADVNDAACDAVGRDRDRLLGTLIGNRANHFSTLGLFEQLREAMHSGEPMVIDGARYVDDGRPRFLDVRAVRVGNAAMSLTWRDVTDRHQLLADLADSRARYRAIMQSELEPHITMTAVRDASGAIVDFTYVEANPAALEYLGMTNASFRGTNLRDMYPSAAAVYLREMYAHTVETGDPLIADDYAYPNEMFAGETRWYDLRGTKLGDGLSLAWRDVTDRHVAAERLEQSEQRYRLLAESAAHVVFRLDSGGHFSFCSDGVQQTLGWASAQLLGSSVQGLVHPDDLPALDEVTRGLRSGAFGPTRVRLRASSGEFRWAEFTGRRLADGGDLVGGWRDVTSQVQAEQALETQARHDALTGLLNRYELTPWLENTIAHSTRTSVLYIDLDNLKDINDSHGHAAGDRALVVTAARIQACLGDGDIAARIGGDEILVVVTEGRDPVGVAEEILIAVGEPIPSEGEALTATVSIGLATAGANDGVDSLIARADRAMYRAKESGRNQVRSAGAEDPRPSS